MKSPHTRTYFFAALALVVAFQTAALGQAKTAAPVAQPPKPKPTPIDIPYGEPRDIPSAVPTSPVEWREFKSEAGGFQVKFPGVPHVEDISFSKGPVELVRHTHTFSLGRQIQFEVDYV